MGEDAVWGVFGRAERGRKRRKRVIGNIGSEVHAFALNVVHPS